MKKRIAFILTMVTVAGCMLTGCGNKATENTNSTKDKQVSVEKEVKVDDAYANLSEEDLYYVDASIESELLKIYDFGRLASGVGDCDIVSQDGTTFVVKVTNSDVEAEFVVDLDSLSSCGTETPCQLVEVRNTKDSSYPLVFCMYEEAYQEIQLVYDYITENGIQEDVYYAGYDLYGVGGTLLAQKSFDSGKLETFVPYEF